MHQIINKLKDDPCEHELLKIAMGEVELGRLTGPLTLEEVDLSDVAVASRFGVAQGLVGHFLFSVQGAVC